MVGNSASWRTVFLVMDCSLDETQLLGRQTLVESGCGVTLDNLNKVASSRWNSLFRKSNIPQINVYFWQQKIPDWTDIVSETAYNVEKNRIPVVSAGGWMKLTLHQINQDGGGPFKCKIDETGVGQLNWRWVKVSQNVPGNKYSINKYKLKRWTLTLHLPKDLNCKGSNSGKDNLYLIRCQNAAQNGPFGGCIPFEQYRPPPPEPAKPDVPKPTYTPEPLPEPTNYSQEDVPSDDTPPPEEYNYGKRDLNAV
ncbi:hypothetical protein TWF281_001812 [Arthrobotrys megalospora]